MYSVVGLSCKPHNTTECWRMKTNLKQVPDMHSGAEHSNKKYFTAINSVLSMRSKGMVTTEVTALVDGLVTGKCCDLRLRPHGR
jgi:hypothetical protein